MVTERAITSQDLSSAALDYTTTFGKLFRLIAVLLHSDGNISGAAAVKFNSKDGSNYDTIIDSSTLSTAANVVLANRADREHVFQNGDEVTITMAKGSNTATIYATILVELLEYKR